MYIYIGHIYTFMCEMDCIHQQHLDAARLAKTQTLSQIKKLLIHQKK